MQVCRNSWDTQPANSPPGLSQHQAVTAGWHWRCTYTALLCSENSVNCSNDELYKRDKLAMPPLTKTKLHRICSGFLGDSNDLLRNGLKKPTLSVSFLIATELKRYITLWFLFIRCDDKEKVPEDILRARLTQQIHTLENWSRTCDCVTFRSTCNLTSSSTETEAELSDWTCVTAGVSGSCKWSSVSIRGSALWAAVCAISPERHAVSFSG